MSRDDLNGQGFLKSDYIDYPKTLSPDDFWGQVRRTIHGRRISEDEVQVIVEAICLGLNLQPTDMVLDLACGNGALSSRLFSACQSMVGVDHSPYLVQIAKSNFELPPRFMFCLDEVSHFVEYGPNPDEFTKVLCYGSFSFFQEAEANTVLRELSSRFHNVTRVFIGNLPDRDRAALFFPPDLDYTSDLDDHASQAGIWRSARRLHDLADLYGWRSRIHQMPDGFFNSHYRFDVILDREPRT